MSNTSANNKRIAKNTLLLYVRMLFMMAVSLYTSRVILHTLGVEDFGIYNVVGGVVAMFSVISGSLSAAISRFITYELGKGDKEKLIRIFSSSVTIQIGLGVIIGVLAESIGIWFLNTKMAIPESRLYAANWVFQLSILTFIINLISVPYNAAIIAHERMSAFAYISIIEVTAKLIIVYLLWVSPIDKLIFYAILMTTVALIIRFVYGYYCKCHFEECIYHFVFDKVLLKRMFSFAGWNFLGAGSSLLMTQGVNILINLFFGVTLNAARGIANQVDSAIQQFVNNFTTALNPQITKSYASGELPYMHNLVCIGSKYSLFLTWIFALPIFLETNMILQMWLRNVPEYAPVFLRLTLCVSLVSVISNTLVTSMLATGNIKRYQIIVGGLGMCVFPLSYIAYELSLPVESAYVIQLLIFIVQLVCRLYLLEGMIKFNIKFFLKNVLIKDINVILLSSIIPLLIFILMQESIFRLALVIISSIISNFIAIYFCGMTVHERKMIQTYVIKLKERI